jgi:molybdopterin-guanine dinucleotide biosynthesis protein A
MEFSGIILAGGKSSRMGTDKGLIEIQGKPMVQHIIDALNYFTTDIVIISKNSDYKKFGYPVIEDEIYDKGAIGGIYTGLLNTKHNKTIVLSCDTPFISNQVINELTINCENKNVLVAKHLNDTHHLIGIYDKIALSKIEVSISKNILKMQSVNENLNYETINFKEENNFFLNLNTPNELKELPIIIKLKCFGLITEKIGFSEVITNIPFDKKNDLKTFFDNLFPTINKVDYKIAVNQVMNNFVEDINGEIEIALLPPFAGG